MLPPKVTGCRAAGTRGSTRPMQPAPLAPVDRKVRALTTIYAPRTQKKLKKKNKTAQSRMLDTDLPVKPSLSPFHPLPAIGETKQNQQSKVILLDINKNETRRPATVDEVSVQPMLEEILNPLTPFRLCGYRRQLSPNREVYRRPLSPNREVYKPHQLIRENTYDVLEPLYVIAPKFINRNPTFIRSPKVNKSPNIEESQDKTSKHMSPKRRFKEAAIQVMKLSSVPERGRLLCLRERETYNLCPEEKYCKLPECPKREISKLSDIFENLELKSRHRDRLKKENTWF